MAKITIDNILASFASTTSINARFQQIEDELNNKVLYRDNPVGEPNSMSNDFDANGNDILNVGTLFTTTLSVGNGPELVNSVEDLLTVGDGLGSRQAYDETTTDLDTLVESGLYKLDTGAPNIPGGFAGILQVSAKDEKVFQIFAQVVGASDKLHIRTSSDTGATYTAWREFVDISQIVLKTGGTFTGQVKAGNIIIDQGALPNEAQIIFTPTDSLGQQSILVANENLNSLKMTIFDQITGGAATLSHLELFGDGTAQLRHTSLGYVPPVDDVDLVVKQYADTSAAHTAVPATATSTGIEGQIAADSSYFYVCVATNTWRRTAIVSW